MVNDAELRHLQRCVDLAAEALKSGDEPFGSVLVAADGTVLAEDRNRVASCGPTSHPEIALARWAEERVKLFKLVWDAVGSEFAGRHHQYEMFYAGAPFVVKGYAYRNYGFDEPLAEVESFLSSYDSNA